MNMIQSAKDQIAALTRSAYRAAVQEGLLPDGVETVPAVEIPKDTANGDYTTTFCLAASKAMRKNPREVANILTQHMKLDGTYFTSVEIAGPGFLNFRLGEKWYADVVEDVDREADAYGRASAQTGAAEIRMEHDAGGVDDRTERGHFRPADGVGGKGAERRDLRYLPRRAGENILPQRVERAAHRRRHGGG